MWDRDKYDMLGNRSQTFKITGKAPANFETGRESIRRIRKENRKNKNK